MAVTAAEVAVLDAVETPAPSKRRFRFLRGRKTVVGFAILAFFVLMAIAGSWLDRKSTRLNSSHPSKSRMPSSA